MSHVLRRGALAAAWIAVTVVVTGFVRPWIQIELRDAFGLTKLAESAAGQPLAGLIGKLTERVGRVVVTIKQGTETITADLSDLATLPSTISGYTLPRVAHRSDVRLVLTVAQVTRQQSYDPQHAYVVYVVPVLAVLLALLLTLARRNPLLCALLSLVAFGLAGYAAWRLSNAGTTQTLLTVRVGQGLWLSVAGYALLGAAGAVLATLDRLPLGADPPSPSGSVGARLPAAAPRGIMPLPSSKDDRDSQPG